MKEILQVGILLAVVLKFVTDARVWCAVQTDEKQHPQLKNVRLHIRESFENLSCFLMPYPGEKVSGGDPKSFRGRLQGTQFLTEVILTSSRWLTSADTDVIEMDTKFVDMMASLVRYILHPDSLQVKKVNGAEITVAGLLHFFQVAMSRFDNHSLWWLWHCCMHFVFSATWMSSGMMYRSPSPCLRYRSVWDVRLIFISMTDC